MGDRVACRRKQEIGPHTPTGGTGSPIFLAGRVVNVKGCRPGLDVTRSRTEYDRDQRGTPVVGPLVLRSERHHSSLGWRARPSRSAAGTTCVRHREEDGRSCETRAWPSRHPVKLRRQPVKSLGDCLRHAETESKLQRSSGDDLGEVPGSRNAYRSWRARPTKGVGCAQHHASHHDELGHYFALRSHSAKYSIGILRLVAT